MKVLAFASYPIEAAATRYRLQQFVGPLADRGISLTIRPFLDSKGFDSLYQRRALARTGLSLLRAGAGRLSDIYRARQAEVILVQREAMLFGPPLIEWLSTKAAGRPMVLDLDDATYVSYTSPTYGRLGKALKWFSKTDDLIRWAKVVTCGNQAIADYVKGKGTETRIIPTVVDTDVFVPLPRTPAGPIVLGWIGTHSTFPYLREIFPVLQELATKHSFRMKIVGAGVMGLSIPGVEIENLAWSLEREVEDFQSFDIGLYPIDPSLYAEQWAAGKSGFKAIQYMAVGIPFVAAPVGAMATIGEAGVTHFHATNQGEWLRRLELLLSDAKLRNAMGNAGRRHVVENYSLPDQADKLAGALFAAAGRAEAS
ncbi:MAG TPA: glycosyltransferase [Pyrinomonadaceae bacterium]|nr:glycosyltransferase [Pyrinomonadaceae bacterium]